MSEVRRAEVPPGRLLGWVERFAASHGEVRWSVAAGDPDAAPGGRPRPAVWFGQAADGSWARLEGWVDADPAARGPLSEEPLSEDPLSEAPLPLVSLSEDLLSGDPSEGPCSQQEGPLWWEPPGPLLVLLVRRGGYAVAVATPGGDLVAHKVGTRRVQGRTAAGGWSQQRFARRRANQADELVEAAVGHAARIVGEAEDALGTTVGALVVGGDPKLADQALTALATGPRARLHGIPRRELRDLPDPRRAVLDDAVRRALAVRVEVSNA